MGKHLTFAEIHVEESEKNWIGKGEKVSIVFQRNSSAWNRDFDNTFPTKKASLPYAGKVCVDLSEPLTKDSYNYPVCTWELLENPRDKALEAAQENGSDAISCTKYLKSRGDAFLKFNQNFQKSVIESEDEKKRKTKKNKLSQREGPDAENVGQFSHGDNRAKALRAKIFATWLIDKYGGEYLKEGSGVLDVAGGKGKLSIELAVQGKIQSTIVDPLVRKHGKKLVPKEAKRIRKAEAPHPNLVAKPFNRTTFLEECEDLLTNSSLCVGLHPDECTEDILDLALQYNKPVAIVPCCVFAGFFPLRTLPCGKAVRTYEDFLNYLLAKDPRLQLESLSFEGRNQVIYRQKD